MTNPSFTHPPATTDNTIDAITPSFRESLQITDYVSRTLTEDATAQEKLNGYLSARTIISTTPSSAQLNLDAQFYNEIGRGTYGIVLERLGTLEIVKRPIRQQSLHGSQDTTYDLWNDFKMHTLIYESFAKASSNKIHVPKPLLFISAKDSEWWSIWNSKFDDQYQSASDLLIAERILPVPESVRDALVDCFCSEQYMAVSKQSAKNKNCLIAPLLGRRKGTYVLRAMLNLRNYDLCIDQMEQLDLDIDTLIDTLAESLAILHFKAHVDAHDIEFVFGTPPTSMHVDPPSFEELDKMPHASSVRPFGTGINFHGRAVHLWVLDFNRVSRIPDEESFVPMALRGFVDQPKAYYPRPRFPLDNSPDNNNWSKFKTAYTRAAGTVQVEKNSELPGKFLKAVEDHYEALAARQAGK